jgi:ABC-type amino acid transport substrate-binding protein
MVILRPALCLTLACLLPAGAATAAQEVRILEFAVSHEASSPMHHYASEYLSRLCAEAGLHCHITSLPKRRSEALMEAQGLDGEIGRVPSFIQQHPEFVMIEIPFFTSQVYAFTAASTPPIDSWDELKKRGGSVAYRRGIFYYQAKLEGMRPAVRPHDVQDSVACLRMVLAGRDTVCIADDTHLGVELKPLLAQGNFGKPLEQLDIHVVLNKRNADLLAPMTAAAYRLRARGVERELLRDYFNPHYALAPRDK